MLTLFLLYSQWKAIQIFVVVHIIFNVLQCYVIAGECMGENSLENVDFMEINFASSLGGWLYICVCGKCNAYTHLML